MSPLRAGAFALVLAALVVLNALRGFPSTIQELGWPYWAIDYRHGYIRRALVGTLFQFFDRSADVAVRRAHVLAVHHLVFVALLVGFIAVARRAAAGTSARTRRALTAGTAIVLLSELVPTIGSVAAYLDVIILALVLAAFHAMSTGRTTLAAVIGVVGPVVHDAFVFLWLPLVVVAVGRFVESSRPRRLGALRWVGAPFVSAAVSLQLHSKSAVPLALADVPTSEGVREIFDRYQFGLGTREAFAIIVGKVSTIVDQVYLAGAWFLLPAMAIALWASYMEPRSRRSRLVRVSLLVATVLSPCLVLLVAWDLSRFLVWSAFGAYVALVDAGRSSRGATRGESDATSRASDFAFLGCISFFGLACASPHLFAYYEVMFAEVGAAPAFIRRTPSALVAQHFAEFYNRRLYVDAFDSQGTCTVETVRAVKAADACRFELPVDGSLAVRPLRLHAGRYRLTVTAQPGTCASSTVRLAVESNWAAGGQRGSVETAITQRADVALDWTVDAEEAALASHTAWVFAPGGCVEIERLTVVRLTP